MKKTCLATALAFTVLSPGAAFAQAGAKRRGFSLGVGYAYTQVPSDSVTFDGQTVFGLVGYFLPTTKVTLGVEAFGEYIQLKNPMPDRVTEFKFDMIGYGAGVRWDFFKYLSARAGYVLVQQDMSYIIRGNGDTVDTAYKITNSAMGPYFGGGVHFGQRFKVRLDFLTREVTGKDDDGAVQKGFVDQFSAGLFVGF